MSLLYNKVSSMAPKCGAAMPKGKALLSAADIAMIAAWINDGAAM